MMVDAKLSIDTMLHEEEKKIVNRSEVSITETTKMLTVPIFDALLKLCDGIHGFPDSPVWERIFYCELPLFNEQLAMVYDHASTIIATEMLQTNPRSKNFNKLLLYLLTHLKKVRNKAYDCDWPYESRNALHAIRIFLKTFVRILDKCVEPQSPSQNIGKRRSSVNGKVLEIDSNILLDKRSRGMALMEELLQTLIFADTNSPINYSFYLETIDLVLILFSSQLYSPISSKTSDHLFLDLAVNQFGYFANGLVARLVRNIIENQAPPTEGRHGLFLSAYSYIFPKQLHNPHFTNALKNKSLSLLLLLETQLNFGKDNPYTTAIGEMKNTNGPASPIAEAPTDSLLPFKQIFEFIVTDMKREETSILLYQLLLLNTEFKIYFLSRTDPEAMLIAILQNVFDSVQDILKHRFLYIQLGVLLVLSQDGVYNKFIQKMVVSQVPWYTERTLKHISLGGILILVLVRTIHINLSKHHDIHIHTICLSILSNISTSVIDIDTIVAQRLISVFEQISKKYFKIFQYDEQLAMEDEKRTKFLEKDDSLIDFKSLSANSVVRAIYSDLVALFLEFFNSVISHNLGHNPHLVYTLLQRQEIFLQLEKYDRFSVLVGNIDNTINHFNEKIEQTELETRTVDTIMAVIEKASQTWSGAKLEMLEPIKFISEIDPEAYKFNVPFVWSLIAEHDLFYWDLETADVLDQEVLNVVETPIANKPLV
ncbi:hypothetical protein HDV01_000349 [Terramyces sp. JEL0728]|nr:hypothetical protein HDV01_000349 [Terramyces sp. JEL0728]